MPRILTTYFGELDYSEDAVFQFPYGLPGFEAEHAFLFIQKPQTEPLMFLQSLREHQLCFMLLPILAADPQYKLALESEELAALQLPAGRQPVIGSDILCAAILRAGEGPEAGPTANLMAPIVVNLKKQIGIQSIQADSGYNHQHPILTGKEAAPCW